MAIWDYDSYRNYLVNKLGGENSRTGLRKQMAAALPVHTTFVSQVLKGRSDFSLEQAENINSFLEHSEDECEYFILLVLRDRAGTLKLKTRFDRKLDLLRQDRINIQKRIAKSDKISQEDRENFYSSYLYGAIHVLVGISKYKNVESLSHALKLPRSKVQKMVEYLVAIGLLKEEKGKLSPGKQHVHLGNESELVAKHHSNWRLHTLHNLQNRDPEDIHYSACLTISNKDVLQIKDSLLKNLKENIDIVSKSSEEEAYVLSFDFYKLVESV